MLGERERFVHSSIIDKFEVMSPRSRIYQNKLQLGQNKLKYFITIIYFDIVFL